MPLLYIVYIIISRSTSAQERRKRGALEHNDSPPTAQSPLPHLHPFPSYLRLQAQEEMLRHLGRSAELVALPVQTVACSPIVSHSFCHVSRRGGEGGREKERRERMEGESAWRERAGAGARARESRGVGGGGEEGGREIRLRRRLHLSFCNEHRTHTE